MPPVGCYGGRHQRGSMARARRIRRSDATPRSGVPLSGRPPGVVGSGRVKYRDQQIQCFRAVSDDCKNKRVAPPFSVSSGNQQSPAERLKPPI